MKKTLAEHDIDISDIDENTLDMFPYFDYSTEHDRFWVYTEESAYIEHVAIVVQAFIKKFRPKFVFKLTWCESCDKPRIGEFGGGWLVVSKDEVIYGNTHQQADEIAEALLTGNFKA
jgi:hypothetical protein